MGARSSTRRPTLTALSPRIGIGAIDLVGPRLGKVRCNLSESCMIVGRALDIGVRRGIGDALQLRNVPIV
jgi:hypothetical protein